MYDLEYIFNPLPRLEQQVIYFLDCTTLPFETPEGVEVYFDNGFTEPPVPKGSKIFYHCEEGHFPDGKTWHIGQCKNGQFTITPLEDCTTEKVEKVDDDEKPSKAKKTPGIKRKPQKGGKYHQ